MKTAILAGGYGTRIRDVREDIPKPMIPIGNMPVLWHIMKIYGFYGLKDFVLCLGYKSETIKEFFIHYQYFNNDFSLDLQSNKITKFNHASTEDWTITFANTGMHAHTGARVKRIAKYLEQDEHFMLTYGDGVGNINIQELIDFHKSHGKLMTVTGVHPPGRFGELSIDDNQVTGFNEKPQTTEGWISAGFFVCNRKVLDYLNDDEKLDFERGPVEQIVKENQMMIYKHDGFWMPMDTSRDHKLLNDLWNKDEAPWKSWS